MEIALSLTFDGNCREAFDFYKDVFGNDFDFHATHEQNPSKDKLDPKYLNKMMHVSLPITLKEKEQKFTIMGCDYVPGMYPGQPPFKAGNNVQISLLPSTRGEADKLYAALVKDGGSSDMPLKDMFWNAYYGQLTDKFGVIWSLNVNLGGGNSGAES